MQRFQLCNNANGALHRPRNFGRDLGGGDGIRCPGTDLQEQGTQRFAARCNNWHNVLQAPQQVNSGPLNDTVGKDDSFFPFGHRENRRPQCPRTRLRDNVALIHKLRQGGNVIRDAMIVAKRAPKDLKWFLMTAGVRDIIATGNARQGGQKKHCCRSCSMAVLFSWLGISYAFAFFCTVHRSPDAEHARIPEAGQASMAFGAPSRPSPK